MLLICTNPKNMENYIKYKILLEFVCFLITFPKLEILGNVKRNITVTWFQ